MKVFILLITLGVILGSFSACGVPNKYNSDGRDTIFILGNGKFTIGEVENPTAAGNMKVLTMYYDNKPMEDTLLSYVNKYKKKGDLLYVTSEEGYAIVDGKSNTCKLLVTVEKQWAYRPSDPTEDKNITNLNSYDEFTQQEQDVFATMQK